MTGLPPFVERFPPPEQPWTQEYVDRHRALVSEVLDDRSLATTFREGRPLPPGFGVGFDERVVELPWLFAQPLSGRMLDAGSALNHEHLLGRLLPRLHRLHVVTQVPEELAFTERSISYAYEDLRDLPYRDGLFDVVACISTIEHVGMDNQLYGSGAPAVDDPEPEAARALAELARVIAPGGRLYVTVPYGAADDHGWFRQYDREAVQALRRAPGLREETLRVFRYTPGGWEVSDLETAADARYRDYLQDQRPVPDLAAAARAVVCFGFVHAASAEAL